MHSNNSNSCFQSKRNGGKKKKNFKLTEIEKRELFSDFIHWIIQSSKPLIATVIKLIFINIGKIILGTISGILTYIIIKNFMS